MVRSTRILGATLAMACVSLVFCASASAQSKKNKEFIPGTVVSIEKDKTGRNYKMKFKRSDDEEELDVTIGLRTQLLVSAKGDPGFLKPSMYVQTKVILTNNEYYAKDFTVILGGSPPPFVKPDPANKDVVEIGGKVVMTDTTGMMVQCAAQPRKVTFEAEKNVTVKIADASLIKEGDMAEIEGTIIKAKKNMNATMNAMAVNVTSTTDINADEYFASVEERKKPKSAKAKAAAKSKADAGADAENPFKDVDKMKGTKSKDAAATKKFDDTDPFKNVDKKKTTTTKEDAALKGPDENPFKSVEKKKTTKSKDEKSTDTKPDAEKPETEKKAETEKKETEKKDDGEKKE